MVDRSPSFFDLDDRLAELSLKGDGLERVQALVDFEMFRPALEAAVPRADRLKGGRPAFDHVLMFKVLILQAMHALSDERTEFLIKDRLSFMRFLGLRLPDAVPDANTIWTFREALKKAEAIDGLFRRFDEALRSEGFLAMSGQIVDATIVATPKQIPWAGWRPALLQNEVAYPFDSEVTHAPERTFDRADRHPQRSWRDFRFDRTQSLEMANNVGVPG
jgi:transposase, IS5 family